MLAQEMSTIRCKVVALLVAAVAASAGRAAEPEPALSSPPVVVKVEAEGFHWQDAGLGAAAALAATLLVFGLVLTVRQGTSTDKERSSP